MVTRNLLRATYVLLAVIAVWSVFSIAAAAQVKKSLGEIVISGAVTVNGQTAVSYSTIFSDSVINTSANSSAIISLGKAGKVELQPNSTLKLEFTENSFSGVLDKGKARLMSYSGTSAVINTKNGIVIGEPAQSNTFMVEVECSHTHIETQAGLVIVHTEGVDKQVAAGADMIVGSISKTGCKPCSRPEGLWGTLPPAELDSKAVLGFLYTLDYVIRTGVVFGATGIPNINTGSDTTVVGPVR